MSVSLRSGDSIKQISLLVSNELKQLKIKSQIFILFYQTVV